MTIKRYIDFKEEEGDGQTFDEQMYVFTSPLSKQMLKANELDEAIKVNLRKIGFHL